METETMSSSADFSADPGVTETVGSPAQPSSDKGDISDQMLSFVQERRKGDFKEKGPKAGQPKASTPKKEPSRDGVKPHKESSSANEEEQPEGEVASEGGKPKEGHVPYLAFKKEREKYQKRLENVRSEFQAERAERLKAEKAVDILIRQLDEYRGKVQVDPKDKQIQELKLQAEIDGFYRDLEPKIKQEFQSKVAEEAHMDSVEEMAATLLEDARNIAAKFNGVIEPIEIIEAQKYKPGISAEILAKQLYDKRAAAFGVARPSVAPKTTAGTRGQGVPLNNPKTGDLSEDMLNFIKTRKGIQ